MLHKHVFDSFSDETYFMDFTQHLSTVTCKVGQLRNREINFAHLMFDVSKQHLQERVLEPE